MPVHGPRGGQPGGQPSGGGQRGGVNTDVDVNVNLPDTSAIGNFFADLFGKRRRSSCRTVSPNDVEAFKAGNAAPWVVWDRVDDIAIAWGFADKAPVVHSQRTRVLQQIGGFTAAADMHMNVFVPMCLEVEGGRFTTDPHSGQGLTLYNQIRERFRNWVRSGMKMGGGTYNPPVGGGGTNGGQGDPGVGFGPQTPQRSNAGFSGAPALLLGVAALFLITRG